MYIHRILLYDKEKTSLFHYHEIVKFHDENKQNCNNIVILFWLRNRFTYLSTLNIIGNAGIVCVLLLPCSLARGECVVSRTAWLTSAGLGPSTRLNGKERPIRMLDRIKMNKRYGLRLSLTHRAFLLPRTRHEKNKWFMQYN